MAAGRAARAAPPGPGSAWAALPPHSGVAPSATLLAGLRRVRSWPGAPALAAMACVGAEPAADHRADAPVSGLAAASGVRDVARDAGGRRPRIVRLGRMQGDVEILAGHPDSAGPFVMRIRELPGAIVPPHTHPVDEHITVVAGTWHFAVGERFDRAALTAMPVGTYAFAPKGTTMFGWAPEGAVVQVHGVGPFHIHWRDGLRMLTDGGAAPAFRYRIGEAVTGTRGRGRVHQGYATGALVQYEVTRPDGQRYMAREGELRRP